MLFMLITLGFVVVVTGCMILINRWMVCSAPSPSRPTQTVRNQKAQSSRAPSRRCHWDES